MQAKIEGLDTLKKDLEKHIATYGKGKKVKAGVLDGATYAQAKKVYFPQMDKEGNVTKSKKSYKQDSPPVALVAFWQEYGTKKIPARSFLRSTFDENQKDWLKLLARLLREGKSIKQAYTIIGNKMKSAIIYKIKSISSPPLSEFTKNMRKVNGKSSDKPLIDTNTMLKAIDYEVENGNKR